MMKTLWRLLRLGFVGLILALVFHNLTARLALSACLYSSLGVPVEVESARVDFLSGQIFFRNVTIKNPEGFSEGPMVKIPYLFMDLDIPSFFDGKFRFEKIEADVGDIRILRASDGRVNWLHLKIHRTEPPAFDRRLKVDRFVLTLRRGAYRDLAARGPPRRFVLDLDNQEYLNVRSVDDIGHIISWEAFKRMGLETLGTGILDRIRDDLEGG